MFYSRDYSFDFTQSDILNYTTLGKYPSRLMNSLSILFPVGEKYFIRAIRKYEYLADTDELKGEVSQFYKQEARHSREHNKFNKAIGSLGVSIDRLETQIENRIKRISKDDPEKELLGTVILEQTTELLAKFLKFTGPFLLKKNSEVGNMWRWHVIEELEHAHVSKELLKK